MTLKIANEATTPRTYESNDGLTSYSFSSPVNEVSDILTAKLTESIYDEANEKILSDRSVSFHASV